MNTIEILTLITLLVLTLGLIVAAFQLAHLKNELRASHDWNRRVTTLKFFFFDESKVRSIWKRHQKHLADNLKSNTAIEIEKINNLSENGYPQIIDDMHYILGKFETLGVGLKNKVADEKMCKDHMKGVLIKYYNLYAPYILKYRTDRKNEAVYKNFQYYAEKWKGKIPVVERDATG